MSRYNSSEDAVLVKSSIGLFQISIYTLLLGGSLLRLIQYLGRSSYWKDELFSVVNIEKMSMWELLTRQPDYNQIAGVGFYLIQKSMVILFGPGNELVTRFYPLLSSILSLLVFYLVARKFLKGTTLICSLILISFSIASLSQSFQAKPYSGDIFFIMFFVFCLISIRDKDILKWQYWAMGVIGWIGAIASLPTAVFAVASMVLIIWKRPKDIAIRELWPCLLFWGIGALMNITYANFVINKDVGDAMFESWSQGFPSTNSLTAFFGFYSLAVWEGIVGFLTFGPFSSLIGAVMLGLSFPGMLLLYKNDKFRLLILLLPLVMALALATFYIYPYFHRTSYYASWPFLILPFLGLVYLNQAIKWWKPWLSNLISVVLVIVPVLVIANFIPHLPFEIEPVKKPLELIQINRKAGDKVYVHTKGDLYMEYYGPKLGVTDYVVGTEKSLLSIQSYSDEFQQFVGEPRVWYFYVGARPETDVKVSGHDIREMLQDHAHKIEEFNYPQGLYETFLILYDFSKSSN